MKPKTMQQKLLADIDKHGHWQVWLGNADAALCNIGQELEFTDAEDLVAERATKHTVLLRTVPRPPQQPMELEVVSSRRG